MSVPDIRVSPSVPRSVDSSLINVPIPIYGATSHVPPRTSAVIPTQRKAVSTTNIEEIIRNFDKNRFIGRLVRALKASVNSDTEVTLPFVKTLVDALGRQTDKQLMTKEEKRSLYHLKRSSYSRQKLADIRTFLSNFYPPKLILANLQGLSSADLKQIVNDYIGPVEIKDLTQPPSWYARRKFQQDAGSRHVVDVLPKYMKEAVKSLSKPLRVHRSSFQQVQQHPSPHPAPAIKHVKKRIFELTEQRWTSSNARLPSTQSLDVKQPEESGVAQGDEQEDSVSQAEEPLDKFRRVSNNIRLILRVIDSLKCLINDRAGHNADFTWVEHTVQFPSTSADKTWDVAEFQSLRQFGLAKTAVLALQTLPQYRSEEQVQVIAYHLRPFNALKRYTRDMIDAIARVATLALVKKRRVIMKRGYRSTCLFFLFAGCVAISSETDQHNNAPIATREDTTFLKNGAVFGEVELILDCLRQSTMEAVDDCKLIVLEKKDVKEKGILSYLVTEFEQKLNFFRNLPVLKHLSDDHIRDITVNSLMTEFKTGEIIVPDTSDNYFLWFIMSGTAELNRFIPLENLRNFDLIRSLPCNLHTITTREYRLNQTYDEKKLKALTFMPTYETIQKVFSGPKRNLIVEKKTEKNDEDESDDESDDDSIDQFGGVIKGGYRMQIRKHFRGQGLKKVAGTYMGIDLLTKGRVLGLGLLFHQKYSFRYSNTLVSKHCSVIQIPMSRFVSYVTETELDALARMIPTCPSDNELTLKFLQGTVWSTYCRKTVEETVLKYLKDCPFKDTLRDQHIKRYARKLHLQDPTFTSGSSCVRYDDMKSLSGRAKFVQQYPYNSVRNFHIPYGMVFNQEIWPRPEQNQLYKTIAENIEKKTIFEEVKDDDEDVQFPYSRGAYLRHSMRRLSRTDIMTVEKSCVKSIAGEPRKELQEYIKMTENKFPGRVRADQMVAYDKHFVEAKLARIRARKRSKAGRLKSQDIAVVAAGANLLAFNDLLGFGARRRRRGSIFRDSDGLEGSKIGAGPGSFLGVSMPKVSMTPIPVPPHRLKKTVKTLPTLPPIGEQGQKDSLSTTLSSDGSDNSKKKNVPRKSRLGSIFKELDMLRRSRLATLLVAKVGSGSDLESVSDDATGSGGASLKESMHMFKRKHKSSKKASVAFNATDQRTSIQLPQLEITAPSNASSRKSSLASNILTKDRSTIHLTQEEFTQKPEAAPSNRSSMTPAEPTHTTANERRESQNPVVMHSQRPDNYNRKMSTFGPRKMGSETTKLSQIPEAFFATPIGRLMKNGSKASHDAQVDVPISTNIFIPKFGKKDVPSSDSSEDSTDSEGSEDTEETSTDGSAS